LIEPALVPGGLSVDDRGRVAHVNDFDFANVRRFYVVDNHRTGFVRAWHGHRNESKSVTVVLGAALVCCVEIDDWEHPSPDLHVHRFVLSAEAPAVLAIPPGFANGFMTLTDGARVAFFSSATLEESGSDDVRFPARYWDPWSLSER